MTEPSIAIARLLADVRKNFPDEKSCAAYLFARRWPDGFVCRCGGWRYSRLKCRAYTYECLNCRRQQSITAGTLLHRSKLSLLVWFEVIHFFAAFPELASASALATILRLKRNTFRRLMWKLGRLVFPTASEKLEGRVAVSHTELALKAGFLLTVAAALELDTGRVRIASIRDGSIASIEAFVEENVKRGETLVASSPMYRGFPDYEHDWLGLGAPLKQIQHELANAERLLNQYQILSPIQIAGYLNDYVDHHNRRLPGRPISFDTILGLVLAHEPTSEWDIVGCENPRKGTPTPRRKPRHRKTATGMRQDGCPEPIRPVAATVEPKSSQRGG